MQHAAPDAAAAAARLRGVHTACARPAASARRAAARQTALRPGASVLLTGALPLLRSAGRPLPFRCKLQMRKLPRRNACGVRASLAGEFAPSQVTVDEPLGEGSFGQVYIGTLRRPGAAPETVVLKKAKRGVENALEMQEAELYMNARVSRDTAGACATFLGVVRVDRSQSSGRLVSGLWLVWAYEGRYTLSAHLRSSTYPRALGAALYAQPGEVDTFEDPELAVAQTVLAQLLGALRQMHSAGLVHRDVKPLNLVLDERERCFKLIDLGACADLRTGKNYAPDETILDPKYSPPEEFLMPIDQAPDLASASAPLALALGASAWARYQPDRFDMYSAGVIFMQLAVPALRSDKGLKAFNEALQAVGHDLGAWRQGANLPLVQSAVLDAFDGAGWELAAALLQPRPAGWAEGTAGVPLGGRGRPSAEEALQARFFAARARKRPPGSKYSTALAGQRALARLEAQLVEQSKAVSNTKFKVEQLKASPSADQAALQAESAKLREQQQGLAGMMSSFRAGVERALTDEARRTARDGRRALDLARDVLSGEAARRSLADVRSELEDEGAPEDTPAGGRAASVPRDPVSAAAAAAAALDALRAKAAAAKAAANAAEAELAEDMEATATMQAPVQPAPPPPPLPPADAQERVGELTDEISVVSARLVAMQDRMNKLLADNNKLLAELEVASVSGRDSDGDSDGQGGGSGAGGADEDGEGIGGTATQGGRYSNTKAQRTEAVAAAAAAMAAAAKVAAASAAVAAANDGRARRRTMDD